MVAYTPPTGAASPNAPYVDKNLASGIQGSAIPAAVPENIQREMVALITESGLTPTNVDLAQVMRAVRSGGLMTYTDVGTANAIVLASRAVKHTAYVPGQVVCFRLANHIAAATTIRLDDLGTLNVVYPGGTPLQRYDFLKDDIVVGRINALATAFVVLSPLNQPIIDQAIVKSVHGVGADFADLNQAVAWLNRRRIAASGSVILQLAAGVAANKLTYSTPILFSHPDGARVTIQGQSLAGSLPAGATLTCTGYTASARLSDTTLNLATLRNVYSTEIAFSNGASLNVVGNLGNLQDVLLTTDGSGTGTGLPSFSGGSAYVTRCAAVGGTGMGVATGAVTFFGTNYALGGTAYGFVASVGGAIFVATGATLVGMSNGADGHCANGGPISGSGGTSPTLYARGNAAQGWNCICSSFTASSTSVSANNGGNGAICQNNGHMIIAGASLPNNGACGVAAGGGGVVNASNTSGSGNGTFGYQASDAAYILRGGGSVTGSSGSVSPAVGSTGNNNAFIA